jgi:hypothetical protein
MSTTEFPASGPGAGINSQIEFIRSKPVVLRNSRFLCWVTLSGSFFAAVMSIGMVLMVFSLIFPTSELNGDRGWGAVGWGIAALALGFMCPRLWALGRAMAGYQVYLDGRGVAFSLGTKKAPAELFLAWDQIAAIKYQRVGNVQRCWVEGTDGSEATFSSYTFFRPKKVARMIAERAGLAIEKA